MTIGSLRTLALLAGLVLGCVTPTLPLPPPAAPTISRAAESDTFHLTSVGGASPHALVIIVNRDETMPRNKRVAGTITDEYGSWDATVYAKLGDILDISQEAGDAHSSTTTITVR